MSTSLRLISITLIGVIVVMGCAQPDMTVVGSELTDDEIAVFRQRSMKLRQKYLDMGGAGAAEVLDAVIQDIEWAKKN